MRRADHNRLLSDRAFVTRMLAASNDDVFEKPSLRSRLEEIEDQLAGATIDPEPKRVALTFNGEPVDGTRSIDAGFGGKAVAMFSEAVAITEAAPQAFTSASGPIGGDKDRRLRIIGPALGSFGFELELPPPKTVPMPMMPDGAEEALSTTFEMLEAAVQGDDSRFVDALSASNTRAAAKLLEFVEFCSARHARFGLRMEDRRFVADDASLKRAREFLTLDNRTEEEVQLEVQLDAIRDAKPDFQCTLQDGRKILGPVDRNAGVEHLRSLVGESHRFRFRKVQSRGQTRYALLGLVEEAVDVRVKSSP